MPIGKDQAPICELVDVRGRNHFGSRVTDIGIANIIAVKDHNIWAFCGKGRERTRHTEDSSHQATRKAWSDSIHFYSWVYHFQFKF